MELRVQGYSLKPPLLHGTSRQIMDLLSTGKPTEPAPAWTLTHTCKVPAVSAMVVSLLGPYSDNPWPFPQGPPDTLKGKQHCQLRKQVHMKSAMAAKMKQQDA